MKNFIQRSFRRELLVSFLAVSVLPLIVCCVFLIQMFNVKVGRDFEKKDMELAGAVHDIGKLTVPKEILDKPTKLTETEWEIMKHHTDNGDELIRAAYPDVEDNTFVKVACDVVRSHHENWDGSGYPDGLKGSDIPLSARIVKIVDVYDSILSDRCYRSAYTKEESLAYMKQGSKSRFDPYILEVFLKIEKQLRK